MWTYPSGITASLQIPLTPHGMLSPIRQWLSCIATATSQSICFLHLPLWVFFSGTLTGDCSRSSSYMYVVVVAGPGSQSGCILIRIVGRAGGYVTGSCTMWSLLREDVNIGSSLWINLPSLTVSLFNIQVDVFVQLHFLIKFQQMKNSWE